MRRKSYLSRTVGLLGGTATFDVYTPDDIEMDARSILVRGRKADLSARMMSEDGTWRAMLGGLKPKQPFDGKHFATLRDRDRLCRAIEETWSAIWTPETSEQVFPTWFIEKWVDLGTKIRTTFGEQREAHLRQRDQIFKLLAEWRNR
jgi:hypothetical protein